MAAIQPKLLTWARETAGLAVDQAARALGLSEGVRLAAFEEGKKEPSPALLERMAKIYRRPLLVFYLAEPPQTGDRGQDFRTLQGPDRFNPHLDALVRDIKARQGLIRSMLEDNDDAVPLAFIGSVTTDVPIQVLSERIAERLGFFQTDFRGAKSPDEAFAYLRARIEGSGVFVLLLGNLGSHHTSIPVEIFRGFALADPIAPMIVINDQDARNAWSFTAFHELVHLWLGQTGVSGADTDNAVEQYCNDVAGELLVPARDLGELSRYSTTSPDDVDEVASEIAKFAFARRVSRAMVAYKLLRTGVIKKPLWSALRDRFTKEWREFRQQETEKLRAAESGPNYYVVRRHRVGRAVLDLVRRSLNEGNTTYTKAGRVLGVKPRNVEPLLSVNPVRGAR
jgi:Zn-dependent peptidase ImmA (M78 family)/transcriptional regulator with XRE-family HTH domain